MLYNDYDREGVKNIFDPEASFTPGAGKWGLHGTIEVQGELGTYIFFVSFGRTQGDHEFDEGINEVGLMRWQSQPRQTLDDRHVRQWINHEPDVNAIHLFLRTSIRRDGVPTPYTYLGEIEYAGHDPSREQPVYFSWKLRTWPIPDDVQDRILLSIEGESELTWETPTLSGPKTSHHSGLELKEPPQSQGASQAKQPLNRKFIPRLDINFARKSALAKKIGDAGERLVVEFEKGRLENAGLPDLAGSVLHVAKERGDGAGYDVLRTSKMVAKCTSRLRPRHKAQKPTFCCQ